MSISRIAGERNQAALMQLVSEVGNDVCADCKERNPRWASYSLGIFICVHCASIHRKMGTHISKVKSLTMDNWSKEQVEVMRAKGNINSNNHYNPDERRHPPPTNMIDQERDSDLEKYIRAKYILKSFKARPGKANANAGPSKPAFPPQSDVAPVRAWSPPSTTSETVPTVSPPATSSPPTSLLSSGNTSAVFSTSAPQSHPQPRSVSQPVAPSAPQPILHPQLATQPQIQRPATQPLHSSNPVWSDLAQLQTPASDSSLPLQYAPQTVMTTPSISIPTLPNTGLGVAAGQFSALSASPNNPYPSSFTQQGMLPGPGPRSMSLNSTGLGLNLNSPLNSPHPGMGTTMGVDPSMHSMSSAFGGGHGGGMQPSHGLSMNTASSPVPFMPPTALQFQPQQQQQQPQMQQPTLQQLQHAQSYGSSAFGQPAQPMMMMMASHSFPIQQQQQQQQQQHQQQGSPVIPPQSSPMFAASMLAPQMQVQAAQGMFGHPGQAPLSQGSGYMQTQQPGFFPQQMQTSSSPAPVMFGQSPAMMYGQQQQQQQQQQQADVYAGQGWQSMGYSGQQQPQQQQQYQQQQRWGQM